MQACNGTQLNCSLLQTLRQLRTVAFLFLCLPRRKFMCVPVNRNLWSLSALTLVALVSPWCCETMTVVSAVTKAASLFFSHSPYSGWWMESGWALSHPYVPGFWHPVKQHMTIVQGIMVVAAARSTLWQSSKRKFLFKVGSNVCPKNVWDMHVLPLCTQVLKYPSQEFPL